VGNENRLGDALWGEAISISMALSALLGPYIGGIADHLRIRRRMLILFTFLCILSVASFSFLEKGMAKEGGPAYSAGKFRHGISIYILQLFPAAT
jgi:MFS-type transporter involved in bile tolerance (Atg22 family)